ncbi:MAG: spermidine/putrescine ABC transporter permease PotC [Gammaproteobacteria bacterium]|nr:spermidine/putrescine ABC transporter permease PotC [Gammaproteobacteria bacterium]
MNRTLKFLYLFFIYVFLYLPIVVLITYSFNDSKFSAFWHDLTFKWYKQLFHDHSLLLVTGHSFLIAVLASTVATVLGLAAAVALFRYRFYGKKLIQGLVFILIVVPDLVFGVSLLMLFVMLKVQLGFWTLLSAHITFCLPFVLVIVYSRLQTVDKNIFAAARDLGANDFLIFMRIIIPLMMPALIAGWLLSFTLSMDDVVISFFVTGPTFQILPLYIYSLTHVGITPEVNALCTLIFVFTLLLIVAAQSLIRRKV